MGRCQQQQLRCTCGFSDLRPTGLCLLLSPLGQQSFWAQDWFKLINAGGLLVRAQWVSEPGSASYSCRPGEGAVDPCRRLQLGCVRDREECPAPHRLWKLAASRVQPAVCCLWVSSHCYSVFYSQEIERLKSEKPTWERRLRWEGMKSVFGGPPSLLWMNPFVGFRLRRLQMRTRRGGPEFSV